MIGPIPMGLATQVVPQDQILQWVQVRNLEYNTQRANSPCLSLVGLEKQWEARKIRKDKTFRSRGLGMVTNLLQVKLLKHSYSLIEQVPTPGFLLPLVAMMLLEPQA